VLSSIDFLFLFLFFSNIDPVPQEIGFTHMRILEGVGTLIQLAGLVARLCKLVSII
jgi:hypothetical protein